MVNAYQVATLALLLPLATLGDLVGYRRVYLGGLLLFTAASFGCVLSASLGQLVLARTVQGMGSAGIMAVNAALLRLIYPRRMLGRGVAINSMVVATASVAGPSVAAGILSVASWPWLFALNVPLGLLVLAMGWKSLPPNAAARPAGARLSWLDVALNALMFGLVFLGADALGTRAGQGPQALAGGALMLGAGLLVGVVYVRRQLAQPLPLFPLDLLRITGVQAVDVHLDRRLRRADAGLHRPALPAAGPLRPLAPGGRPADHRLAAGHRGDGAGGRPPDRPRAGRAAGRHRPGLLACGLALLATLPAQPSNLDIVWRMALCGVGFGLFQSPNNHTIVTSAPPHRSGGASGMLGTARLTGQTLGAVLLAVVFSATARTTRAGR